jgi:hypothetical protein
MRAFVYNTCISWQHTCGLSYTSFLVRNNPFHKQRLDAIYSKLTPESTPNLGRPSAIYPFITPRSPLTYPSTNILFRLIIAHATAAALRLPLINEATGPHQARASFHSPAYQLIT